MYLHNYLKVFFKKFKYSISLLKETRFDYFFRKKLEENTYIPKLDIYIINIPFIYRLI